MNNELRKWAVIERQFLKDEIKWLEAGTTLTSPSGDDISAKKLEELKKRLEHAHQVLGDANG